MNWIVAIPTWFATLAWATLIVWYWTRAKWWKNRYGINTMLVSATIFSLMLRLSIYHFAPEFVESRPCWGLGAYIAAGYAALERIWLVEKAQRDGDRRKIV